MVSGKAVWFPAMLCGFTRVCMVSGKTGWFQEVPGCFRKDWVVLGKAAWRVVSGKGVVGGKTGCWFQKRLGAGLRKGLVVSGKAGRFQERLGGFRLCGGFSKDRVVVLAVSRKQAGWFQERLGCFMKDWVLVSGVVSGGDVWFQERPSCFR